MVTSASPRSRATARRPAREPVHCVQIADEKHQLGVALAERAADGLGAAMPGVTRAVCRAGTSAAALLSFGMRFEGRLKIGSLPDRCDAHRGPRPHASRSCRTTPSRPPSTIPEALFGMVRELVLVMVLGSVPDAVVVRVRIDGVCPELGQLEPDRQPVVVRVLLAVGYPSLSLSRLATDPCAARRIGTPHHLHPRLRPPRPRRPERRPGQPWVAGPPTTRASRMPLPRPRSGASVGG